MIKTVSLKCPECNANLSIEKNRTQCFCEYCGAKILIDDGSTTHTYRNVDEARIKEAEVEKLIRLKELELEERRRASEERAKGTKIKISILSGVVSVLLMVIGWLLGSASGDSDSPYYMLTMIGMLLLVGTFCVVVYEIDKSNK